MEVRDLIWSQCWELWFWSCFISCWCNCAAVHLASPQKGCPSVLVERRPPGVEDEFIVLWDRSSLADGGLVLAAGSGNRLANSCYFLQPSRVWSRLAWWLSVAHAGCRAPFELPCFKVELIPTAWLNGPVSALLCCPLHGATPPFMVRQAGHRCACCQSRAAALLFLVCLFLSFMIFSLLFYVFSNF